MALFKPQIFIQQAQKVLFAHFSSFLQKIFGVLEKNAFIRQTKEI